jgi:cellulose synthase/poly-beta-1,6-N-acetylglucosamine synthase-like glycosyltransferase
MPNPFRSNSIDVEKPTVSVIVPVFRGGDQFRRCLAGLTGLISPPVEIIVVVDGDDDGSGEAAEASGARVLRLSRRSGPAAARNAGARMASGDVLLFLDADVIAAPTVVAQVRNAFQADPGLAALIGSYDVDPGDPGFLSQYRNLLHHFTHQTSNTEATTFWGACGAIRRSVFFDVGGFDEAYEIPAIEDIELGYRLVHNGYRIRLDKDLHVKHLKRWEVLSMLRTDILQRAIPWSRLLLRQDRIPKDLNLRPAARVSGGLTCMLLASLLAALWWPTAFYTAAVAAVALTVLNLAFYHFLLQHRGLLFTLQALPWHWLYFLYASVSFAYVKWVEGPTKSMRPRLLDTTSLDEY